MIDLFFERFIINGNCLHPIVPCILYDIPFLETLRYRMLFHFLYLANKPYICTLKKIKYTCHYPIFLPHL